MSFSLSMSGHTSDPEREAKITEAVRQLAAVVAEEADGGHHGNFSSQYGGSIDFPEPVAAEPDAAPSGDPAASTDAT